MGGSPDDPLIGRVLAAKYAIKSKLGSGGFGAVYLARHATLGADVAVKVLAPRRQDRKDISQRFRREAKTLSRLRHPHIVEVLDFGKEDGLEYLVMEFLKGVELTELLDGPVEWRRTLHIAKQIALALAVAHQIGIVHRDLKPANVMLVEIPGFRDHVKVLDFGIAKLLSTSTDLTMEEDGPTQGHQLLGTPTYMSPEQCRAEDLDGRADLYSLGALLFRMLTGVAPYSGTNVVQVIAMHLNAPVPSLTAAHPDGVYPPGLDQMVSRLLAKNPDERYLNSAELIEVIIGLEQGQVAASASSKGITPARVLGGLVAAAVVAAAAIFAVQPDPLPPTSTAKPQAAVTLSNTIRLEVSSTPAGAHFALGDQTFGVAPLTLQATQTEAAILDPKGYTVALDGHQLENIALLPKRDAEGRLVSVSVAASMKPSAPSLATTVEAKAVEKAPPPVTHPRPKRTRRARRLGRKPPVAKRGSASALAKPTAPKPAIRPEEKKSGVVIDLDL
jgi:serine/threonine protein kinase